jgi:hypothetical protein
MTPERDPRQERRYRVTFVGSAMLMLGIVVTLPFSLASIVDDVLGPATGAVLPLLRGVPPAAIASDHSRLHVAVTHLDEVQLLATLRVSGHHVCEAACPWRDRLLFVSVTPDDGDAEGLPPSAGILLPQTSEAVSEAIQLPVRGVPIRYPFDRYHLDLGIALQRVYPDGRVAAMGADQAPRHLFLSIQGRLPQKRMSIPVSIDPRGFRTSGGPVEYVAAYAVSFERPRYLRVLAVLLVLLIAAAAAYSVLLRPLEDLIVNSGALVLGVWGVRAILVPINLHFLTAVDLALSMVILFLLGGLSTKALILAHDRGNLRILGRRSRAAHRGTGSEPDQSRLET